MKAVGQDTGQKNPEELSKCSERTHEDVKTHLPVLGRTACERKETDNLPEISTIIVRL